MIEDIKYCISRWRLIHLIGISGLRARYARSAIGQLWLTLFTLIQILITGVVWALIWKMEIKTYLPYVGIGHVIYLYVSQTINESTGCIVAEARLFYNDPMPLLMAVFSHLYKHFLIFLHNLPVIIMLMIYGNTAGQWYVALLSFVPCLIFVFFSSVFISIISTRYRDITQIVALIFQLTFLITPVMWKLTFVPEQYRVYFLLNPLTSILELTRNPLLGVFYSDVAMLILFAWTVLAFIAAVWMYRAYRRNFIFWL